MCRSCWGGCTQGYRNLHALELLLLPPTRAHAAQRAHGLALLHAELSEPLPQDPHALKQHTLKARLCGLGDRGGARDRVHDAMRASCGQLVVCARVRRVVAQVEELVRSCRSALTAAEQLRLQPRLQACPALAGRPAAAAAVAYDTALAFVAEGFARGWPHYVHCADAMFQVSPEDVCGGENPEGCCRRRG